MKKVLFVCNHNAGRSQMAEAFFNAYAPSDLQAESAGSHPRPGGVWPNVIEAMREVGIDLENKKPAKLTREMQLHADWAVTLACGAQCPYVPATVEDWDIDDPADKTLDEVRAIRDEIERRVRALIDDRIEGIRTDRTAHESRLARLLPDLAEKFEGVRSEGEIRACADAILTELDESSVRSFVIALAHRRACECLREEQCQALATA